jgi:hypothetical protein
VGHVDNTDPATGVEPEAGDDHHAEGEPHGDTPHRDFVRIVRRGSLSGTIATATLVMGPDGLADIFATLALSGGDAEFNGVTGTGTATLSSLTLTY